MSVAVQETCEKASTMLSVEPISPASSITLSPSGDLCSYSQESTVDNLVSLEGKYDNVSLIQYFIVLLIPELLYGIFTESCF